ncbi:hypothetical protein FVB9288_03238 [Flavobacterium sp. CECT 9288]|jgi:hypothetical protein|uniref:hypothetical protein n=1 Tax=Flavobacterium sp. CECT 9288 TaxID=2845819 RepID=UPI001E523DD0|nr:hypothetical protein [Flavobacterium sp. CECT 9288]CAH0337475.1 hypothetical protein FVB9288_03238 [Flavobacterium sp. CECT 9288]
MKAKVIVLSFFLMSTGAAFSQAKVVERSIISKDASIRTFHDLDQLKSMQKGELIELYTERVRVLVKILPNIALAKLPGVTISDLGIPNDAVNKKALEDVAQGTQDFLTVSTDFQKKMLPYADKNTLVAAILFFETTMKSLHEFEGL